MSLEKYMDIIKKVRPPLIVVQRDDALFDIYNDKLEKIESDIYPDGVFELAKTYSDTYMYCHENVCSLISEDEITDSWWVV